MSAITVWSVIAGLAAVTVVTRCTLLLLGDRLQVPQRVTHALRYAPICALTALVAPVLVDLHAGWPGTVLRAEFIGGVVAILVMQLRRSMLLTMAAGMVAYLLAAALLR
jgi:branched-subunit amino acid transport protein